MARSVRRGVLAGSLAEQVYQQLRAQIIVGERPAGAKLVELDLAEQMGTSQGTVREALHRLEREGLVVRQAHRATYVTPVEVDAMYELFVIRSDIERFAVRRALRHMTPADDAHLEALWQQMHTAAGHNDIVTLSRHDLEFHRCLCQWSRSGVLLNTWQPLFAQIQRFVVQTHPDYFPDLHTLADTHVPFLEALRARDTEAAVRLIQEHVMLIWSWLGPGDAKDDGGG